MAAHWDADRPDSTRRGARSMDFAHASADAVDVSQTPGVDLPDEPGVDGLTRRDREILMFERQWWKYAGAKEQAIRELFDMSGTRYYQVLNALIDTPAALGPSARHRGLSPAGYPAAQYVQPPASHAAPAAG